MAYYKNYESSTPGSMQRNQWPVWPKPHVIQIGLARQKYYGTHEVHNDEVVHVCSRGIRSKDFLSRPDQPRLCQAKAGNWVDGSYPVLHLLRLQLHESGALGRMAAIWQPLADVVHRGCDSWWAEWIKHAAGSNLVFTGVLDDVPHFYAPPEYTESSSFKDGMRASGEKVMMEISW